MHENRRVWVLPAALAALILSIPAEVLISAKIAEPYPGLFQPAFWGASQNKDGAVKFPFLKLVVDGQRVKPKDLLTRPDRRDALEEMFPPDGMVAHVDAATKVAMRTNLAREAGIDPRELVVTWQERRYHLDTGKITRHKTRATYRVDLREEAS